MKVDMKKNPETAAWFDTVEDAIAAIGRGEIVIVTDDENRENEGDLVMAADQVTPEKVNFLVTHGRGLVCVALEGDALNRLDLVAHGSPSSCVANATLPSSVCRDDTDWRGGEASHGAPRMPRRSGARGGIRTHNLRFTEPRTVTASYDS